MRLRYNKTLITGKPGLGKTTLVQTIIHRMNSVPMAGFYTTEIRSKGSRLGFELQSLEGKRQILSHVDINSPHRVGKYGVDTVGFERFLETLGLLNSNADLIVVDEIGKMELFSNRFKNLIHKLLNTDKQLLATIALKGQDLIRSIKKRPDIKLFEITQDNRDGLPNRLIKKSV